MGAWEKLGDCPECGSGIRLRVYRRFRRLLELTAGEHWGGVPEGLAISVQCKWCNTISEWSIADFIGTGNLTTPPEADS